jgi:hypothetical protein
LLEPKVGFGEPLGQFLVSLGLLADFYAESVHQHGCKKNEKHSDRQLTVSLHSDFKFL